MPFGTVRSPLRLTAAWYQKMRKPVAILCLLSLLIATACTSLEGMRGESYKESENWGQQLRKERDEDTTYGGVSNKAQQIERNLGVK